MKLREYRDKRDPEKTNEPFGADPRPGARTQRGAYVVHQHAATRMHYDLRVEIGGVLASFAIPKGPSLDPAARNLAIHTEDHPLEYLDFEAVIPDGTYGAGAMILWDAGTIRYLEAPAEEGIAAGKLDFVLDGRKLKGRYALVRIKPKGARSAKAIEASREWLLLKKKDAHSDPARDIVHDEPRSILSGLTVAELADAPAIATDLVREAKKLGASPKRFDGRSIDPMRATPGPIPDGEGWLHELKFDGVRIVATKDDGAVVLKYRTGRVATHAYPEVARAMQALVAPSAVIDGEIVAFDGDGNPSFGTLAKRIHLRNARDIHRATFEIPVVFMAFDLLALDARDLRKLALSARKRLLARLIPGPGVIRVVDHIEGHGAQLLRFCEERGLEGVVSKRAESPYEAGPRRSPAWIKTKLEQEEDFVVVGHTRGEGRRRLGALDIAQYEGNTLVQRGKVGSGIGSDDEKTLLAALEPLATAEKTAMGEYLPAPRGRTHVRPELVIRVKFLEYSPDGRARHPVFIRVRDDKSPRDCVGVPHLDGAPPDNAPDATEGAASMTPEVPGARPLEPETSSDSGREAVSELSFDVPQTNRNKLFWPDLGYTKGDLIDYYRAIAPRLLPYLRDRPVMLVRYPDGIDGKSFYQWNVPHGIPPWVRWVSLAKHAREATEGDDKNKNVFVIDRPESLVYIANLACIPIHVLASRLSSPEVADFLTIDFDVGRSSLAVATELARTLRELLETIGLSGFPKTSGQTGLHVFVGLVDAGVSPRAARTLADLLGRLICERHPKHATMERVVAKRGARVYVDTGQTGPSRTIVAPYSVRATRGARVSAPLEWDELTPDLDPGQFTIRTMEARFAERGDPMAGLLEARPDLPRVMQALQSLVTPSAPNA